MSVLGFAMTIRKLVVSVTVIGLLVLGGQATAFATTIQEVVSPGGIKAWLVEEKSIPILNLDVIWSGGGSIVPAQKAGLANLLAATMDEGAGDLGSRAYQKILADLSISLGFSAGKDTFRGSFKTLSENRDEAFRLFALAIKSPRFDAEPVQRIKGQILVSLNRRLADPGSMGSKAWFELAFKGHPYAIPTDGEIETVKALTSDDLRDLKARQIARNNMVVSVVGDITAKELGVYLDKTFLDLPAKADFKLPPEAARIEGPALKIIEMDIPQSTVMFGGNGVKRDDPDYYAAYVLNYILGGGGFESRLTQEIREKRGLVYSVYTYLSPFELAGVHLGGLGTSNASTGQAIDLVKAELAKIRSEGVSQEELEAAKTYLNGSFSLRLSSNARIAKILASMQFSRLPISYLDERAGLINAVTLDDIKRVAQRLMDPEKLIITVVGKPEGLKSTE